MTGLARAETYQGEKAIEKVIEKDISIVEKLGYRDVGRRRLRYSAGG